MFPFPLGINKMAMGKKVLARWKSRYRRMLLMVMLLLLLLFAGDEGKSKLM